MSHNPYKEFPDTSYWRRSVSAKSLFDISDLWTPKFKISQNDIFATYGSCFAQHFSNALRARGIRWSDCEPAPDFPSILQSSSISDELRVGYNYGIYSSRTQNIYTPTMLLQWLKMSMSKDYMQYEVWEEKGRFYDSLRPTLEPNGFGSQSELFKAREVTSASFLKSIKNSTVFVFTLGLTERWVNRESKMEYAQCPGVAAGHFDETEHLPQNLYFPQLRSAMQESVELIRELNPKIKVLLTVSPVPLVATFQKKHVLVATMEAKSALRAVASHCSERMRYVDYFPSYEIISSFPYKASFYEADLRSVNPVGVNHVMKVFFESTGISTQTTMLKEKGGVELQEKGDEDTVCEEVLLDAFGGRE